MQFPYWRRFIRLEQEFVDSLYYAELAPENGAVYSVGYASIVLSACAEVEVVAKVLCARVSTTGGRLNIQTLASVLLAHWPGIGRTEVEVRGLPERRKPWRKWDGGGNVASPDWWGAYNVLKHDRDVAFKAGSQCNALDALCGLFVLLMYYHEQDIATSGTFGPKPQLLWYPDLFAEEVCDLRQFVLPK